MLISQNARHIFVSIAQFSRAYIDYITDSAVHRGNRGLVDGDLLRMTRYGPFEITIGGDMERLCRILLALSLEGRMLELS